MREKEDQKLNVKVTQEGGREGRKEERKSWCHQLFITLSRCKNKSLEN